jgi:1-acyl-sn-glycerol-3-phosphate acyltransferase
MTDGGNEHQEAAVDGQQRDPRPRRGFWFGLIVIIVKPFMLVFTKSVFTGRENMPRSGGVIFVANHISHFDPVLLGYFIWECRRIPRFLGKASLFKLPIAGQIITSAGQIPVYRDSAQAADAFRDAVAAVEKGECVGVYPEGTITRDTEMWPMTGKTGAARIALMTGCPVIPLGNWGAQEIIKSYTGKIRIRLLPRKTLQVRAGEPVDLSAFEGKPLTNQLLHEATEVIMARIAETLGELRGETPPKELYDLRKVRKAEEGKAREAEAREAEAQDSAAQEGEEKV